MFGDGRTTGRGGRGGDPTTGRGGRGGDPTTGRGGRGRRPTPPMFVRSRAVGRTAREAAGRDRLSALSDDLLHRILGPLDARLAAGQCSLLSRRWRHVWATMPHVTLVGHASERFGDNLLLLRDGDNKLRALTLHSASTDHFAHQCRWLRHVASHGIRVLDIALGTADDVELPDCVFNCTTLEEITVSASAVRQVVAPKTICLPCLKKLHLRFMQLSDPSVADKLTSGCPALEELDLSRCSLGVFRVSSDTVKTLSVTACDYLEIHVSAPSIASLKLSVAGRVKLDAMPSQHLELLRFGSLLKDMMDKPATEGPTFSKMKSLYLGEWLVVDFYRPLAYFFNHAPNLAMLSLDQWKLYEENNGEISGPAYFRWKSTEKLNLPSVLSSDLEILRLRISKDDDAGEFSTLRRMLKEKTKPKEMEVVWF
nr:FBD-associated F-box protein At5g56370-like isoform X2 [Lolium perenne]